MKNLLVYELLYGSTQIPMCLVENNEITLRLPEMEYELYTKRFIDICILDVNSHAASPSMPLVHFLQPGYYIGICKLSEKAYFILGPAIPFQHSWSDIAPCLNNFLYQDNHKAMGRLLVSLPPVSVTNFLNTLCLAINMFDGLSISPKDIYMRQPMHLRTKTRPSLAEYIADSREGAAFHTPHNFEIQLTDAIQHGNISLCKHLLHKTKIGRGGTLSFNPGRQTRYMFVTAASVAARAAMKGGLDYEAACSMADIYCQRMDSMSDMSQIIITQYQMILDFCEQVYRKKNNFYSSLVQVCCDYIQKHTHDKIYLKDLAEVCHLSERYLSKKFQQETGISIVDYIHKAKIEEAKLLLRHTYYTINEISNYLGYSNQSYFTTKFKEFCELSPYEFRQKMED